MNYSKSEAKGSGRDCREIFDSLRVWCFRKGKLWVTRGHKAADSVHSWQIK